MTELDNIRDSFINLKQNHHDLWKEYEEQKRCFWIDFPSWYRLKDELKDFIWYGSREALNSAFNFPERKDKVNPFPYNRDELSTKEHAVIEGVIVKPSYRQENINGNFKRRKL